MPAVTVPLTEGIERIDARLVRRAREGDAGAFDQVAMRLLADSYRLASAILGNEPDAADATQHAIVAAWRELPNLDDSSAFGGWFHRILVTECRMRLRRQAADGDSSGLAGPTDGRTPPPPPVADQVDAVDAVEHAFDRLDASDRALVVLRHLDERTVADIAAMLRLPAGTVKGRLQEARRFIQASLDATAMAPAEPMDELLATMLERRGDRPRPEWLVGRVREALAEEPQARRRRRLPRGDPAQRWSRFLLVAGLVVLIGAPVGVFVARRSGPGPRPAPTMPAAILTPSAALAGSSEPTATPPAATPDATATPSRLPVLAPVLAKDALAVVTRAGDGLRVRSAPGVGAGSRRLEPLLRSGARLLVVDGPVTADGYDWYEVRVADDDDGPSFGWVAAGKDGQAWIRDTEPRCEGGPDANVDQSKSSIEYLACYGDSPAQVTAEVEGYPADTGGELCRGKSVVLDCDGRPTWLFEPIGFAVSAGQGDARSLYAYAHGEARRVILDALDRGEEVFLTLGLDAPEAEACRLAGTRSSDAPSQDELVTECRLRFSVRDATPALQGP